MRYERIEWKELGASAQVSIFSTEGSTGCAEFHVLLHVEPQGNLFDRQFARLCQAESLLGALPLLQGAQIVSRRYFVSDIANQSPLIRVTDPCALSVIQQPPLDGSKVALWLYLVRGAEVGEGCMVHNGYRHLYHWGLCTSQGDSYSQSDALLRNYVQQLHLQNATLEDHCVRTWFFVRDVDNNYAGLVKARRELFDQHGLRADTHYIASTGIGGSPAALHSLVQLDAYALLGVEPSQIRYLNAPTHLNPTHEYGVTFERGTVVEYGDRAAVYISGTASIDNHGQVLYVGDIVQQTYRMWENVEKLLEEADVTAGDLAQIIVYLRDMSDYVVVKTMFDCRFPHVPCVITLAPVCRPTWLIEMECIAIARRQHPQFRSF